MMLEIHNLEQLFCCHVLDPFPYKYPAKSISSPAHYYHVDFDFANGKL